MKHKPIILIAAMSKDRVIGTKNGMPWNVSEEYEQYLSFIKGQTVIMGRKSYEIFGKDLTSKHNLIISRSMEPGNNFKVFNSLEDAIEMAQMLNQKIFIAGGASIYSEALPTADEMFLSIIKGKFEGIAYFPKFDKSEWEIVRHNDYPQFEFFHYLRIR